MRNQGIHMRPPTDKQVAKFQDRVAKVFNQNHPVGTPVRYWSGAREGDGVVSKTRSESWTVCGTAVVMVEGKAGGIALSHIEALETMEAK